MLECVPHTFNERITKRAFCLIFKEEVTQEESNDAENGETDSHIRPKRTTCDKLKKMVTDAVMQILTKQDPEMVHAVPH